MKRCLSRISVSLVTLGLAGLIALAALAARRPFHLVEHGALKEVQPGKFITNGTGRQAFT
jgi:hypothetical protein